MPEFEFTEAYFWAIIQPGLTYALDFIERYKLVTVFAFFVAWFLVDWVVSYFSAAYLLDRRIQAFNADVRFRDAKRRRQTEKDDIGWHKRKPEDFD